MNLTTYQKKTLKNIKQYSSVKIFYKNQLKPREVPFATISHLPYSPMNNDFIDASIRKAHSDSDFSCAQ